MSGEHNGLPMYHSDGSIEDERGMIPRFGPAKFTPEGKLIDPSPEELAARSDALIRTARAWEILYPNPESEGSFEEVFVNLGLNPDGSSRSDD